MNKKGFTLIELLVVVLIIGILAAIALPQYKAAVLKARFSGNKALATTLAEAEEVFYLANGTYTTDINALDVALSGECAPESGYCDTPGTTEAQTCRYMCGKYFVDLRVHRGHGNSTSVEQLNDNVSYILYYRHQSEGNSSLVNAKTCTVRTHEGDPNQAGVTMCKSETGKTETLNGNVPPASSSQATYALYTYVY